MYFSRIVLAEDSAEALRELAQEGDGMVGDHHIIWRFFSDCDDRKRDFLFHRIAGKGRGYYVVSEREPEARAGWTCSVRTYEPRLEVGDRLAFVLRVNPVVRRRDAEGRQHRHDVIMDAKRARSDSSHAGLWQEAVEAWLKDRSGQLGFAIESLQVDSYRQHRSVRRKIRFSTVDLSGILRVSDPERFGRSLIAGIGPQKTFGCGLLLIRRP